MPAEVETTDQYAARLDAEDQAFATHMQELGEKHKTQQMMDALQNVPAANRVGVSPLSPESSAAALKRVVKLPKDVGIAIWDTVRNSAEMSLDLGAALADVDLQRLKAGEGAHPFQSLRGEQQGAAGDSGPDQQPDNLGAVDVDLKDLFPDFIGAVDQARARMGAGDNGFDIAAQKLFQFVGPFAGAIRVMGGLSKAPGAAAWLANTGKAVLAEAATSYSAFDPHEARFADLLREYAPESMQKNRLVNAYIDYAMSDPTDSDAEGRWKNAVDNTMAGLPFVLGSAVYQGGKALARGVRQIGMAPKTPGSPATQSGMVGDAEPTVERLPVTEEYAQFERQLTPEARTELLAMRKDAEAYHPTFSDALQGVAKDVTGDAKNALVADLKGWDRISQKVVGEEGGQAGGIRDMVRGTILVRNRAEAEQVWNELAQRLTPADLPKRESLLTGTPDNLGYMDLKMNITGPNGRIYEVQVTTPGLWAAKNGRGHEIYDEWRTLRGKLSAEKRNPSTAEREHIEALEKESRTLYAAAFDSDSFFSGKPLISSAPVSKGLKEPSDSSSSAPK